MAILRNALAFIVFLFSSFVYGETTAPTNLWAFTFNGVDYGATTAQSACDLLLPLKSPSYTGANFIQGPASLVQDANNSNSYLCYAKQIRSSDGAQVGWQLYGGVILRMSCESAKGWTLTNNQCVRPDCAADQTRNATTGVCECTPPKALVGGVCKTTCPTGFHARTPDNGQCEKDCFGDQKLQSDGTCGCDPTASGMYSYGYGDGSPGNCANGCTIKPGVVSYCPKGVVAAFGLAAASSVTCYTYGSATGSACGNATAPGIPVSLKKASSPAPGDTSGTAADGTTKDPMNTPANNKDPMACGGAGGNYITVGGVAKCTSDTYISPGDATAKVSNAAKTSTTTNADGTTTTTTTDTKTVSTASGSGGVASSSTTTTTTKDAAGNTTGTSSTGTNQSGNDDFCTKNPGLQICKGGLNEEATQKKILEGIGSVENVDEVKNAVADAAKVQESTDAHQATVAKLDDGSFDSAVNGQKQSFRDLMAAWWDPVTITGCTPLTANIGNRVWTLDPCPTAVKISEIGAYCMWVMLAFGAFALVTKRAE